MQSPFDMVADPDGLPSFCACGSNFSVNHALSCNKGGFPSLRHNEIQDLTASLVSEVCSNVAVEPHLQPLTGEEFDGASATRMTVLTWILLQMAFGGVLMKEPFLMFAFLIPMCIQIVIVMVLLQYIGNMR